jgi:hypothetical protein
MRLFLSSLLSVLSGALLPSGFSVAASGFLGHERELAVLANDVSKIRRNAHCVRDALICGRAGRNLHGGESREETLVPMPRQRGSDDTGFRALPSFLLEATLCDHLPVISATHDMRGRSCFHR